MQKKNIDSVHFENFCTALEEVVDVTNGNTIDLLLVSDAKHKPNFSYVHKNLKKCKEEYGMVITYKESQLEGMASRGRKNISEHVSIFSAKPLSTNQEPRLFYTLTSCATNVVIQVDMVKDDELPTCRKRGERSHPHRGWASTT